MSPTQTSLAAGLSPPASEPSDVYGVKGIADKLGISDYALLHGMERHPGYPRETIRVYPGRRGPGSYDRAWSADTLTAWRAWLDSWPGRGTGGGRPPTKSTP